MDEPRPLGAHIWKQEPHGWYVEEAWCNDRLFQYQDFSGEIWDAACGMGRVVHSARRMGFRARGSDIVDRGYGFEPLDFFSIDPDDEEQLDRYACDNIVSNPPYHLSDDYLRLALRLARQRVALLFNSTWDHGDARSRWLKRTPLKRKWLLTPRPSMPPGAYIEAGLRAGGGTKDYAWFVWEHGYDGEPFMNYLRR